MAGQLVMILSMILVNNYVLVQFLGICPFLGVSKLDSAVGMLPPSSLSWRWRPGRRRSTPICWSQRQRPICRPLCLSSSSRWCSWLRSSSTKSSCPRCTRRWCTCRSSPPHTRRRVLTFPSCSRYFAEEPGVRCGRGRLGSWWPWCCSPARKTAEDAQPPALRGRPITLAGGVTSLSFVMGFGGVIEKIFAGH